MGLRFTRWERALGPTMPFLVYLAILVATMFSVALEWDALVEPSAASRHAMHAIAQQSTAPPPSEVHVATPAQTPKPAAVNPPAAPSQPVQAALPPPAMAEQAVPPQCDAAACARAYGSFRASDCTWQPFAGPRRICTKGVEANADSAASHAQAGPTAARCHIRACAEYYSSFNPSDCTYQPLEGPRRLCVK